MLYLRRYRDTDAGTLVDLWYESWHSNDPLFRYPEPLESWRKRWQGEIVPNNEIAVVVEAGELLGFCAINVGRRYLSQLFVRPDSQGKGVGSTLLDWAKSVCPEGFNLHNLTRNSGSRRFYEHHGLKAGNVGRDEHSRLETIEYIWAPED